jgi:hypothetical protein
VLRCRPPSTRCGEGQGAPAHWGGWALAWPHCICWASPSPPSPLLWPCHLRGMSAGRRLYLQNLPLTELSL